MANFPQHNPSKWEFVRAESDEHRRRREATERHIEECDKDRQSGAGFWWADQRYVNQVVPSHLVNPANFDNFNYKYQMYAHKTEQKTPSCLSEATDEPPPMRYNIKRVAVDKCRDTGVPHRDQAHGTGTKLQQPQETRKGNAGFCHQQQQDYRGTDSSCCGDLSDAGCDVTASCSSMNSVDYNNCALSWEYQNNDNHNDNKNSNNNNSLNSSGDNAYKNCNNFLHFAYSHPCSYNHNHDQQKLSNSAYNHKEDNSSCVNNPPSSSGHQVNTMGQSSPTTDSGYPGTSTRKCYNDNSTWCGVPYWRQFPMFGPRPETESRRIKEGREISNNDHEEGYANFACGKLLSHGPNDIQVESHPRFSKSKKHVPGYDTYKIIGGHQYKPSPEPDIVNNFASYLPPYLQEYRNYIRRNPMVRHGVYDKADSRFELIIPSSKDSTLIACRLSPFEYSRSFVE